MERNISLSHARRILGAEATALTDKELQAVLDTLGVLADGIMAYNSSKGADNSNE